MSNFLIFLCMFIVSQYYCLNNSLYRGFVCAIYGVSKVSNKAFLYKGKKKNPRSTEAATKYFVTQATASIIILLAIVLNYKQLGT